MDDLKLIAAKIEIGYYEATDRLISIWISKPCEFDSDLINADFPRKKVLNG
jgi:hypothetical protein